MNKKGVILDIEESEGDWFEFFESHVDSATGEVLYDAPKKGTGKACFRPARKFIVDRLRTRKKESQFVLNPKTRSMEKVEFYKSPSLEEQKQEYEDRIDFVLTGLKDFFDKNGDLIECTRSNKLKLVEVPVFDRFMARCIEIQSNAGLKEAEDLSKNLKTP